MLRLSNIFSFALSRRHQTVKLMNYYYYFLIVSGKRRPNIQLYVWMLRLNWVAERWVTSRHTAWMSHC